MGGIKKNLRKTEKYLFFEISLYIYEKKSRNKKRI